ncbi:MAG: UPF0093 membrane protein [Paracoccaceae bacterium]|nr:MAG: UPF0093 membrane protein [Paracoccaceae bacterium]
MTASWLASAYPWIKAFHVISVIAWMAGLFYLPRLFAYHADAGTKNRALGEIFKVMERRLMRIIMTPAMAASWVFGLLLAMTPGIVDPLHDGWFHVKLLLVAAMTWFHLALAGWLRAFAADRNRHSSRFYRMVNELPTLLMIGIVIMVIVKPF